MVQTLDLQCQKANIPYEIICLDDASNPDFQQVNSHLNELSPQIKYQYLSTNIGRAKIRNQLTRLASYDCLLFMDCDAKVGSEDYISNYLKMINEDSVICGGRIYSSSPPDNQELKLHWLYGKQREQLPAPVRQQQPYTSFMTNNFLIAKHLMLAHPFEETLIQYGHEDTLFGLALQQKKIAIQHIDNPLQHIGLEQTSTFLHKQNQAIKNLIQLLDAGHPISTKLIRTHQRLRYWGLILLLKPFQKKIQQLAYQQLLRGSEKLLWLDVWKLMVFLNFRN
ncbi:MAG: glycosyltransferase [Saprospiraceae bacterium]|nr:glycosyltransferase [Saprospiraceae bacterium]